MARGKTAPKAAPAPEPEETDEGGAVRGPGEMHELFADYLKDTTGVDVSPEAIFLVTSRRTAFRKTEEYLEYAERLDKERDAKAQAKEERATQRAEKTEEPAEEKPARRSRAKAKAAEDEPAEEQKVTPIRGGRRARGSKAAAPADTADEAQTETAPAAKPARRRRSAPASF